MKVFESINDSTMTAKGKGSQILTLSLVGGIVLALITLVIFVRVENIEWAPHYKKYLTHVIAAGGFLTVLSCIFRIKITTFTLISAALIWMSLGFSREVFSVVLFWSICLGIGGLVSKFLLSRSSPPHINIVLGYAAVALFLTALAYTPFNTPAVFIVFLIIPAAYSLANFSTPKILNELKDIPQAPKPSLISLSARLMYFITLTFVIFNASTPELGSDAIAAYRSILVEMMDHGSFDYSPENSTIRLLSLAALWPQSFAVILSGSLAAAKIFNGSILIMAFFIALSSKIKKTPLFFAISILATIPIVSYTTLSAFYDNSVIFLTVGLILLVETLRHKNITTVKSAMLIGLYLGLMILTKYTTLFVAPMLAIYVLWRLPNDRNLKLFLRNGALIALSSLLVWGAYLSFVYFKTGNPAFPYYSTIFENPYLDRDLHSPHEGYRSLRLFWDITFETAAYAQRGTRNGALGVLALLIIIPAMIWILLRTQKINAKFAGVGLVSAMTGLVFMSCFQNSPRYLMIIFPFIAIPWIWVGYQIRSATQALLITTLSAILFITNIYTMPRGGYVRASVDGLFAKNHSEIQHRYKPIVPISDKLSQELGRSGTILFLDKDGGFIGRRYIKDWYDMPTLEAIGHIAKSETGFYELEGFLKEINADAVVTRDKTIQKIEKTAPNLSEILRDLSVHEHNANGLRVFYLKPRIAFNKHQDIQKTFTGKDTLIKLTEVSDLHISMQYSCSNVTHLHLIELKKNWGETHSRPGGFNCDGSNHFFEHTFRNLDPTLDYTLAPIGKDGWTLNVIKGETLTRTRKK